MTRKAKRVAVIFLGFVVPFSFSPFSACCGSCNRCCCICLSRVPVASLIASFVLGLGFTGFALGLSEGVNNLNKWLKMDIV